MQRTQDKDYPTRERIQECLEAHRKGGKKAILELLEKIEAEQETSIEPTN